MAQYICRVAAGSVNVSGGRCGKRNPHRKNDYGYSVVNTTQYDEKDKQCANKIKLRD